MRGPKLVQRGFTLIELIAVIVVLGILAATALPKFVNLQDDARQAATQAMAGAISSASAMNYAARKANGANGSTVLTCFQAGSLLVGGLPNPPYTFVPSPAFPADNPATCIVLGTWPDGTTKQANAYVTGIN